jgi:hypothetical protein
MHTKKARGKILIPRADVRLVATLSARKRECETGARVDQGLGPSECTLNSRVTSLRKSGR